MTTNTQAQSQTQAPVQGHEAVSMTMVKDITLGTVAQALYAVGNTARFANHATGILADKAENYRKQIQVQDAITHNALMNKYIEEAEQAGLDVSHITW